MDALDVAARTAAAIPQPSVKVEVSFPETGQKKSSGIGARYRQQLEAQKQKAAGLVSGPSRGEFVCPVVLV